MRIGMLLPGAYALHNPGDGRRVQAYQQSDALEALGHDVIRMDGWRTVEREKIDVLHIFEGGFGNFAGVPAREHGFRRIVLAPFIDSNTSFFGYKLASLIHLKWRLLSAQYVLRKQVETSDRVIARSAHEKERFVRSLGAAPEKVPIVLNGVEPPPADRMSAEEVRREFGLPEKFVLHVSMYTQARKNVLRLVEATERLKVPIVIAGTAAAGATLDALKARAAASGGRVRLMAYLERRALLGLYAACDVFALPSTHEGTGLSALEAASLGAKVVVTKHGGPPDYFGKWAEYVEPSQVADIERGVKAAWEKPRGGELAAHVAAHLTWENSARQLVAAYEGIRAS